MHSLLLPVKVVSDGPIYHLYFAARWWKAGRLFLVAAPFGENAATYFPANGDAWFAWLMVSWGGDRLAKVGQAPFLFLAAAAVFRMARTLGASRNSAIISTCWFVTSTPFLIFSFEPNVDTLFVAFYLIAVSFFLGYLRQESGTSAVILGGLAAGIAMGTKPVGVVFVVPLLLILIGAIGIRARSVGRTLAAALPALGCTLVTSGFWYGRNLLLTGNPLYPLNLELFGRTILPGWYGRDAMQYSAYYLPMSEWRALVDILLAVLDPRLAPLWLAALAGAWAWGSEPAGSRRRAAGSGRLPSSRCSTSSCTGFSYPTGLSSDSCSSRSGWPPCLWQGSSIGGEDSASPRPSCLLSTCSRRKPGRSLSRRRRSRGISARSFPTWWAAPLPLFERIARGPRIPADHSAGTRLIVFLSMGCFAGLGVWAATRTGHAGALGRKVKGNRLAELERGRARGHGCPRDGRSWSRRQAAFLPGFPGFLCGVAEPGKPLGIRGHAGGLRRHQHPLLPAGGRV